MSQSPLCTPLTRSLHPPPLRSLQIQALKEAAGAFFDGDSSHATFTHVPTECTMSFRAHGDKDVNDVMLNEGGSHLITSGNDGLVRMWETASGQLSHTLRGGEAALGVDCRGEFVVSGESGVIGEGAVFGTGMERPSTPVILLHLFVSLLGAHMSSFTLQAMPTTHVRSGRSRPRGCTAISWGTQVGRWYRCRALLLLAVPAKAMALHLAWKALHFILPSCVPLALRVYEKAMYMRPIFSLMDVQC